MNSAEKTILLALAVCSFSLGEVVDRIVALVDEEIILQSELEEMEAAFAGQPQFQSVGPAELRAQLLEKIIDEKVMIAIAERDTTIDLTETELDSRVREQVSRAVEENGGETRFEQLLEEQAGFTLTEYKSILRERLRSQILVQKLQQKFVGNVNPSGLQTKNFFAEYKDSLPVLRDNFKVSHLEASIKANFKLDQMAYHKCDSIIKLLNSGEEFEKLAKALSDDPSGEAGGDLGFTKRGTLDATYEAAAFRMNVGDYTRRPVRSKFGYHVIKVTGKRDVEVKTSHILVLVNPTSEDTVATYRWLDSLRHSALEKKNFAEVAEKYSEDKATKPEGGDLGWFTATTLLPQYRDAVDTLAEGDISVPILIDGKYHLLRVDQKLAERHLSLKDDWTQISMMAKNYYTSERLAGHLDRWKKEIHIENRLAMMGPSPSPVPEALPPAPESGPELQSPMPGRAPPAPEIIQQEEPSDSEGTPESANDPASEELPAPESQPPLEQEPGLEPASPAEDGGEDAR